MSIIPERPVSAPSPNAKVWNEASIQTETRPGTEEYFSLESPRGGKVRYGKLSLRNHISNTTTSSQALNISVRVIQTYFVDEMGCRRGKKPCAKEVLFAGLLQAKSLQTSRRPKNRTIRARDSYQMLAATALRCSRLCIEESDKARRRSNRNTNRITANAFKEEACLKGKLSSEIKNFLTESKRCKDDVRKSNSFLRKKLQEILDDWIE